MLQYQGKGNHWICRMCVHEGDKAMQLSELRCDEFTEKLASGAPVPGGGGAAALMGALGAALCAMAGNLTVGKPRFAAAFVIMTSSGSYPMILPVTASQATRSLDPMIPKPYRLQLLTGIPSMLPQRR